MDKIDAGPSSELQPAAGLGPEFTGGAPQPVAFQIPPIQHTPPFHQATVDPQVELNHLRAMVTTFEGQRKALMDAIADLGNSVNTLREERDLALAELKESREGLVVLSKTETLVCEGLLNLHKWLTHWSEDQRPEYGQMVNWPEVIKHDARLIRVAVALEICGVEGLL